MLVRNRQGHRCCRRLHAPGLAATPRQEMISVMFPGRERTCERPAGTCRRPSVFSARQAQPGGPYWGLCPALAPPGATAEPPRCCAHPLCPGLRSQGTRAWGQEDAQVSPQCGCPSGCSGGRLAVQTQDCYEIVTKSSLSSCGTRLKLQVKWVRAQHD